MTLSREDRNVVLSTCTTNEFDAPSPYWLAAGVSQLEGDCDALLVMLNAASHQLRCPYYRGVCYQPLTPIMCKFVPGTFSPYSHLLLVV